VHQELMLFPDRSVEENVAATALPTHGFGFIDRKRRRRMVRGVLEGLSTAIDLRSRVAELPLSHRQLVEIGRALCGGGSVFVLDEPTSALSRMETEALFAAIRRIAAEGATVIFVSHRLHEVFSITDAITVLRDGRIEGKWRTADASPAIITRAMVGDVGAQVTVRRARPAGATAMVARGAAATGAGPLDLELKAGEVTGLAGLEGSGVSRVLEMLGGVIPAGGDLSLSGRSVRFRKPADAIAAGVVYMPPDRKKGGLWLDRSSQWNVGAAEVSRMHPLTWLPRRSMARVAMQRLDTVGVRRDGRDEPVIRFSGGNQQRVMLARALEMRPSVLLLNDFTRGVDVRAKAAIHQLVRDLAGEGIAICLTSSDFKELLEVADRVVCMRDGRIIGTAPTEHLDELGILSLVTTGAQLPSKEAWY
jgi:ABC-type sugar transport system ATPase subunit